MKVDNSEVVLVEWENENNIYRIWTEENSFYCGVDKENNCLILEECYKEYRDQINCCYWINSKANLKLDVTSNAIEYKVLPKKIKDALAEHFLVDKILYCTICNSSTYEEYVGSNVSTCGHIHYIESMSEWGGCGYSEHNEYHDKEYAKSFEILFEAISSDPDIFKIVSDVYKTFKSNDFQNIVKALERFTDTIRINKAIGSYPKFDEKENEIEPAMKWLMSIDMHPNCQDAVYKTNTWFNKAILALLNQWSLPNKEN